MFDFRTVRLITLIRQGGEAGALTALFSRLAGPVRESPCCLQKCEKTLRVPLPFRRHVITTAALVTAPSKGGSCIMINRADVGCQCSLPVVGTRTVGTQLSERRLIRRTRSLGVQTKLPTTGAAVGTLEARPAEQSIEGLISTSQKPPPSPPTDWSQPEIEDDDRCVTAVTHLLLQDSHGGIKQCCQHSAAGMLNRECVL